MCSVDLDTYFGTCGRDTANGPDIKPDEATSKGVIHSSSLVVPKHVGAWMPRKINIPEKEER
jgi:hypothetical protein